MRTRPLTARLSVPPPHSRARAPRPQRRLIPKLAPRKRPTPPPREQGASLLAYEPPPRRRLLTNKPGLPVQMRLPPLIRKTSTSPMARNVVPPTVAREPPPRRPPNTPTRPPFKLPSEPPRVKPKRPLVRQRANATSPRRLSSSKQLAKSVGLFALLPHTRARPQPRYG